jgi:hypothetical protein
MLPALALVNNNDFVQEAVYTNGNNKPPSLICYTKTQLDDMKLHLRNDVDCVVGFDRTFNLGPTFVTNLVYKNKKVLKKSSSDHPIFIGPVFFHWDVNYCTYHTFFSHVKARIDVDIKTFDIRFGSDDEGGLTKAIDSVFPNSSRLLCTKHIKDNVIDHSKNKLSMTKDERNDVIEDIFGVYGLVSANDTVDFNMKSDNLCNTHPVFSDWYNTHLKK